MIQICEAIHAFRTKLFRKHIVNSCQLPTHSKYYIATRQLNYCRTHNVRVCLYIACRACGSASLYIKTLYLFLTVLALSAAVTIANIEIRYDAKTPQFAIFGTRTICVFYSILSGSLSMDGIVCNKSMVHC